MLNLHLSFHSRFGIKFLISSTWNKIAKPYCLKGLKKNIKRIYNEMIRIALKYID